MLNLNQLFFIYLIFHNTVFKPKHSISIHLKTTNDSNKEKENMMYNSFHFVMQSLKNLLASDLIKRTKKAGSARKTSKDPSVWMISIHCTKAGWKIKRPFRAPNYKYLKDTFTKWANTVLNLYNVYNYSKISCVILNFIFWKL